MTKTLDEWTESVGAAKYFRDQVKCHIDVLADNLSDDQKRVLIRMIMTSFRNAALDCGAPE